MDSKTLIIAYSGSLDAFDLKAKKNFWKPILKWFWTYKHNSVDSSTRSAFYLINAVKILKSKYGITPQQLKFQFWGSIHPLNIQQSINLDVSEFFEFSGYLPKKESLAKLNQADVLFLPLEMSNTSEHSTLFIPGKLYEYLNAKKPVLGLCENSDCKDILVQSGIGFCVEPNKPYLIAEKLLYFINNRSELSSVKPNNDYIQQFDFKNKTAELAKVFDALVVK
ncbi:MAG: hypothetical protein IT245_08395 [Bacteroidia bacterium]|nr:hypothetical protein [Bacteroidia bacterium]